MKHSRLSGVSGLLLLCLVTAGLGGCASSAAASRPSAAASVLPAELAMDKLAQDLLVHLPSPLRLGIDDFYLGNARRTALGRYLGQLFVTSLVRQGGGAVTPVERQRLDAALAESNFNLGQLMEDPARFSQVGAFLPAQAIASANLTVLPDRITVTLRVFSTSNGDIIGAATVSAARDANLDSLIPVVR